MRPFRPVHGLQVVVIFISRHAHSTVHIREFMSQEKTRKDGLSWVAVTMGAFFICSPPWLRANVVLERHSATVNHIKS
jgi:hypothetical protein